MTARPIVPENRMNPQQIAVALVLVALIHIRKIIETVDGGCLIVLGIEKQKSC